MPINLASLIRVSTSATGAEGNDESRYPVLSPDGTRVAFGSVDALQARLDGWLHHYNHERPHLGYRNQGRRPWDTVERFVRQEG